MWLQENHQTLYVKDTFFLGTFILVLCVFLIKKDKIKIMVKKGRNGGMVLGTVLDPQLINI